METIISCFFFFFQFDQIIEARYLSSKFLNFGTRVNIFRSIVNFDAVQRSKLQKLVVILVSSLVEKNVVFFLFKQDVNFHVTQRMKIVGRKKNDTVLKKSEFDRPLYINFTGDAICVLL